ENSSLRCALHSVLRFSFGLRATATRPERTPPLPKTRRYHSRNRQISRRRSGCLRPRPRNRNLHRIERRRNLPHCQHHQNRHPCLIVPPRQTRQTESQRNLHAPKIQSRRGQWHRLCPHSRHNKAHSPRRRCSYDLRLRQFHDQRNHRPRRHGQRQLLPRLSRPHPHAPSTQNDEHQGRRRRPRKHYHASRTLPTPRSALSRETPQQTIHRRLLQSPIHPQRKLHPALSARRSPHRQQPRRTRGGPQRLRHRLHRQAPVRSLRHVHLRPPRTRSRQRHRK